MKKNYNVSIDDNGTVFFVVINNGTSERLVAGFSTLAAAWEHIVGMYRIEQQEFTCGKKDIPVTEWIDGMKKAGYIE